MTQTQIIKGTSFLLALCWMTCSGGSQVPCCEDTQAAYRRVHVMRD